MNPYGSYRRLRDNAIAAMVGSIELYNKPRFSYRDECSVILLVNAWELLFKATLSKSKQSIYYPKKRGEDYRTVSWTDAAGRLIGTKSWPTQLNAQQHALTLNVEHLADFRDNAVHFYNAPGFGVLVHSLAQQSVLNFRDFLRAAFGVELGDEISWTLMPLGVAPPVDPITYLIAHNKQPPSKDVRDFLDRLEGSVEYLVKASADPSRLMTQLPIQLISVKKVGQGQSGVTVSVDGSATSAAKTFIKKVDPNISHPLSQTDVLSKIAAASKAARPVTSYTFQAVVSQEGLRGKNNLYYKPKAGAPQWSEDVVTFINNLTAERIDKALAAYKKALKAKSANA